MGRRQQNIPGFVHRLRGQIFGLSTFVVVPACRSTRVEAKAV
jgi:hypothetical protein